MDDFIQILIWLFIIISFFSSFFKKKTDQQKPETGQRQDDSRRQFPQKTQSATTVDKEEYDILKEIESMFNPDLDKPRTVEKPAGLESKRSNTETSPTGSEHLSTEQQRKESEYISYERTGSMDTKRSRGETTLSSSEHSFSTAGKISPRQRSAVKEVDSKALQQAEAFEEFLKRRKDSGTSYASVIKNKLRHPASLKEYVIISEIINRSGNRSLRQRAMRR